MKLSLCKPEEEVRIFLKPESGFLRQQDSAEKNQVKTADIDYL